MRCGAFVLVGLAKSMGELFLANPSCMLIFGHALLELTPGIARSVQLQDRGFQVSLVEFSFKFPPRSGVNLVLTSRVRLSNEDAISSRLLVGNGLAENVFGI